MPQERANSPAPTPKRSRRSRAAGVPAPRAPQTRAGAGSAPGSGTRRLLPPLLLLALTLVAFWPALRAGWIWDDDDYVTANRLLDEPGGLARIWTERGATPQYYPLVFSSFWLEKRLWGLDPTGFHATNLALHALVAILLWRALLRLRLPGALFAAALFAVHPIHAETVAWVTERKNLLSAVFFLAALLAYWRFRPPGEESPGWRGRPVRSYVLALLAFAVALLAKTIAASLPVVIALVEVWRARSAEPDRPVRIDWRRLLPLAPMLALGALFARTTVVLEKTQVGAQGAAWDLTFFERCLVAGRALFFYVAKLVWPQPLIFIYPRWQIDARDLVQWAFPIAALGALGALALLRRRIGGGPLVAALAYGAMIFPALGFVNVFPMLFSWVADHFLYLASAPLLALFAAIATIGAKRTLPDTAGARSWLRPALAGLVVALLAVASARATAKYRDAETLWRDTLAQNPNAWIAHNNLGVALATSGRTEDAIRSYERALALRPEFYQAHSNLAEIYRDRGRDDLALPHLEKLVELAPGNAVGNYQLGVARLRAGRREEASALFARALEANPTLAAAHARLADLAMLRGDWPEAAHHYAEAARRDARDTRSLYLESLAESARGDDRAAAATLRRVLAVQPDNPVALARLARLLAASSEDGLRDGIEAVALARRAADLSGEANGAILDVLATANAEAGDFAAAAAWARRAAAIAGGNGRFEAARRFAAHAAQFARGERLRVGAEPPPSDLLAELAAGP